MSRPAHLSLLWLEIGVGLLLLLLAGWAMNPRLTEFISSPGFHNLLERETSKGMKFQAHYAPLQRVGVLGMHADSFHGDNGWKTIVSLDAHDISGWFNPLGVGLRRWQIDDLHIKSGTVMLQKNNATPGEPKGTPPIPWWALFWPYRVHLEDVKVDSAEVLFKLQDKESGIYETFLEITPNGRDFEYDAHGGVFKTPMTPTLGLRHVHLLIRKPRLYCSEFVLGDDLAHPEAQLHVHGEAGLQDDRSIGIKATLKALPIARWAPEKYRGDVLGEANGDLDYHSSGTGLETAQASGSIAVVDGILRNLPQVRDYVRLTGCPDPGDLHLSVCRFDVRWDQGALTLANLRIECPGVFEVSGSVSLAKDKTISGVLDLGLTDPYLKWLPTAKTAIFTHPDGDYYTTPVHFSGTSQKPVQDLSPRVVKEIEHSPFVAVKLFFNAL